MKYKPFIYSFDYKFNKTFLKKHSRNDSIAALSLKSKTSLYYHQRKRSKSMANPLVKKMSQVISRGKKLEFFFIF